jgi:hypothetical protein
MSGSQRQANSKKGRKSETQPRFPRRLCQAINRISAVDLQSAAIRRRGADSLNSRSPMKMDFVKNHS